MRVTVTGATGLIGSRLVAALKQRGDHVTVLSRHPDRAQQQLDTEAVAWEPASGPAPLAAVEGRDALVHLAGDPVAQRWNADAKRRIRESRVLGTAHLVQAAAAAGAKPKALVCASAVGYYGPHGDEPVDEQTPPGSDFLAEVCVAWEAEASKAADAGVRVVLIRTGVVLDRAGGALAKMLLPFRLGLGGPVAGGRQYMPWIHADDVVGIYLRAIDDPQWSGPVNATAPAPVTNRVFAKALGRALHRPAVAPAPGLALRLLYGEMAQVVTTGQNAVPTRALALGYPFAHPELDEGLRDTLG